MRYITCSYRTYKCSHVTSGPLLADPGVKTGKIPGPSVQIPGWTVQSFGLDKMC